MFYRIQVKEGKLDKGAGGRHDEYGHKLFVI